MNAFAARIFCFLTGYLFGMFLTAEIVTRKYAGKSSFAIGTGNPGMANVMAQVGFRPGLLVLAGDLGKTILAWAAASLLFSPVLGPLCGFYAGLGCTVGHCFPAWHHFRGGKGVSCCCMVLFLISPVWGLAADVFGMLVVFFTQYLCLGGAAIPLFFVLPAFLLYGQEAGILTILLAALCFFEHWPAIRTIPSGTCPKNDVWGKICKGLSRLRDRKVVPAPKRCRKTDPSHRRENVIYCRVLLSAAHPDRIPPRTAEKGGSAAAWHFLYNDCLGSAVISLKSFFAQLRKPGKFIPVAITVCTAVIFSALALKNDPEGMDTARFLLIMAGLTAAGFLLIMTSDQLPLPFGIALMAALPPLFFLLCESYTHLVWGDGTEAMKPMKQDAILLNLAFYYLLLLLLFFLTARAWLALRIEAVLAWGFGMANDFVIQFRSTPMQPWDLLSAGTAFSVAGEQSWSSVFTKQYAIVTMLFLTLFYVAGKTSRVNLTRWSRRLEHGKLVNLVTRLALFGITLIPTGIYLNTLWDPDVTDRYDGLDATLFTPRYMYRTDGFAVAYLMNLRFLRVAAPEGYSSAAAVELLSEQDTPARTAETLPNVVIVMNECFSDPAVNGAFDTNVDYMPNVRSILNGEVDDTISGYAYSSVLGGNTADSEFECLTGNSMAFLPTGSIPYQQYLFSNVHSIVNEFSQLGYHTVAMHPYNASGWNRNKIYPLMGFDEMLFRYDFQDTTLLRKYIDDASDYRNVERVLNETDEPTFIFNVTMQNHSGYGMDYANFHPDVVAEFKNTVSNKYLNNYLSLIKIADEAVGGLLEDLSSSDEPTIVVFFGDHQPNDYVVQPIFNEYGIDADNETLEQRQTREMVPFFIWANYDIGQETGLQTSLNYVSSILFQTAGLPLSEYQSFLLNLHETLPVVNSVGVIDSEGNYFTQDELTGDAAQALKDYEALQYYYLFDKNRNVTDTLNLELSTEAATESAQ